MTTLTKKTDPAPLTAAQQKLCDDTAATIRKLDNEMMNAGIEIGRALLKVKAEVGHGRFGSWLKSEVRYTDRTAQNYMNVARSFGDKPAIVSKLPKTITYKLASMPDDKRNEIVGKIKDPENPPMKDIKERVANVEHEVRQAKMKQEMKDKEAKLTSAERKKLKAKKDREEARAKKQDAEFEVRQKKQQERQEKVTQAASHIAAKMDLALLGQLVALMNEKGCYSSHGAVLEGMKKAAQGASTIEGPEYSDVTDAEIAELEPDDVA